MPLIEKKIKDMNAEELSAAIQDEVMDGNVVICSALSRRYMYCEGGLISQTPKEGGYFFETEEMHEGERIVIPVPPFSTSMGACHIVIIRMSEMGYRPSMTENKNGEIVTAMIPKKFGVEDEPSFWNKTFIYDFNELPAAFCMSALQAVRTEKMRVNQSVAKELGIVN